LEINKKDICERDVVLRKLINIHYERNDVDFHRGCIRVRGDVVEIFPSYLEKAFRIEFWGDEVEEIAEIDPLTGKTITRMDRIVVYPAKHFITSPEHLERALEYIKKEIERAG